MDKAPALAQKLPDKRANKVGLEPSSAALIR